MRVCSITPYGPLLRFFCEDSAKIQMYRLKIHKHSSLHSQNVVKMRDFSVFFKHCIDALFQGLQKQQKQSVDWRAIERNEKDFYDICAE